MKRFIYYPDFEVKDETWLKFALLYLEEINPIIPSLGERYLSESFRNLMDSTDLIKPIAPADRQGRDSSLDAIYSMEKVLRCPERFISIFGIRNILEKWQNPENHDTELFMQKYSTDWYDFCIQNRIASPSCEGMRIPKEVAFIFMSILANTIGEAEGLETITDYKDYDHFSILVRQASPRTAKKIDLIKSIISLQIPSDLKEIDINKIIKLRNKDSFRKKLRAFHAEVDNYFNNLETTASPKEFIDSLKYNINDLVADVITVGSGAVSVGLGVWSAFNSQNLDMFTQIEKIAEVISFLGTLKVTIACNWKNTRNTRYCRKYLAELTKIS
ncbi:MAG: hypothetical protein PWQ70_2973 [Clostridiales bacterium]|nr:hypothetical protein [Clostridiales bacterium]